MNQRPKRLRRVELAVPGSNERMMAKAAASKADLVFLDLEDAVAPNAKVAARAKIIEALKGLDWTGKTRSAHLWRGRLLRLAGYRSCLHWWTERLSWRHLALRPAQDHRRGAQRGCRRNRWAIRQLQRLGDLQGRMPAGQIDRHGR